MNLYIPSIDPEQDTLSAALAYAKAGWYVLPVRRITKHAGSVLGKDWPSKTSRDTETIIGWFAGTDHVLALHVGRSGAVCFDVDRPSELPDLLRAALAVLPTPFQSTRDDDPERGHYLFAAPPGRHLGNSKGKLAGGWGEVRGRNGIIVVAPSEHAKQAEGGRYHWVRTGPLITLPEAIAGMLPDAAAAEDAATDTEVRAFLERHTRATRPELIAGVLTQFNAAVKAGESRHQSALRAAVTAMREAAAGLYPALDAAARIQEAFVKALSVSRDGYERILPAPRAKAEFRGILSWAIAQVAGADLKRVREDVDERLPAGEAGLQALIAEGGAPAGDGEAASGAEGGGGGPGGAIGGTPGGEGAGGPADGGGGDDDDVIAALEFERRVAEEIQRIRVREEAARRLRRERDTTARPPIVRLDEFLAVPDEPVRYRIHGLLPVGGRVVLAAQFKAGKTTLVGNLVRSLVDVTPFLGRFGVEPFDGRVVVIDDELDEGMIRRWLRDQGINRAEAAAVISLRGRLSSFDILDPDIRGEWAAALRAAGATIVVLDCLAPILDSLGLSEDKEAGRFLVAFDELLKEAGITEAVLVHHMGHSGERARGASRLRDWPDVEWRLVREKTENSDVDPAAPRYFSAYGRDVDVPESRLVFDPVTRHLELEGGSRADHKNDETIEAIVEYLTLEPGRTVRQIEEALGEEHGRNRIREALRVAVRRGVLMVVEGPRKSRLHWVASGPASTPEGAGECAATAPPFQDQRRTDSLTCTFSAPLTPSKDHLKDEDHDECATTAPPERHTETAGQSASAPVRHHCATTERRSGAVSAPVRPPIGGWRTGALDHRATPTHDPRDPSDLLPPAADQDHSDRSRDGAWVLVDGRRVDPATGELLETAEVNE